jgi:hypothetical protein
VLTDEQVGQLLASQANCARETRELKDEVLEIKEKLAELIAARARSEGGVAAARWILGGVLGVLLSAVTWLVQDHFQHNDRIGSTGSRVAIVERDLERHERAAGHSGHGELAGEVRELRVSVGSLSTRVSELQGDIREMTKRGRR